MRRFNKTAMFFLALSATACSGAGNGFQSQQGAVCEYSGLQARCGQLVLLLLTTPEDFPEVEQKLRARLAEDGTKIIESDPIGNRLIVKIDDQKDIITLKADYTSLDEVDYAGFNMISKPSSR